MSTKIVLQAVAAAVLFYAGTSGAQAAPFTNGSFEDGTFTPDGNQTDVLATASTTMPGWTVTGHEIAWINAGNPFGLTASDGSKFLDLTSYGSGTGGGVEQSFDTVAGGKYTVTFDLGGGTGVSILASAGSSSATATGVAAGSTTWESQLLSFVATGTTTLLSFVGTSDAGTNYIGLDHVQVTFNGVVAATPIPGSILMLGTGLLGLGFAGYRRRKNAGSAALSAI